jgi:hypothetical protein
MLSSTVKPQVIIIGTGHPLQAGRNSYTSSQLKAFSDLLDRIRKKYRVKFIAEEMSSDVLGDFGVTATVAKTLADRKKLAHRYVDLTCQERSALGVDRLGLHQTGQTAGLSAAQFAALEKTVEELRECVWLVRILDGNKWPVLLICGANHAPRVQYLFNTVGKLAVIEVNDYEAQPCNAPDIARKAAQGR